MNKLSYFLIAIFFLLNKTNKLFSMDKYENILREKRKSILNDLKDDTTYIKDMIESIKSIMEDKLFFIEGVDEDFEEIKKTINNTEEKVKNIEESLNKNPETTNLSDTKDIIAELKNNIISIFYYIVETSEKIEPVEFNKPFKNFYPQTKKQSVCNLF